MSARISTLTIASKYADAWVSFQESMDADYFYGGTRLAPTTTSDSDMEQISAELALSESAFKNQLINLSVSGEAGLFSMADGLPSGFLGSRVGGARCVIRPKSEHSGRILSNPGHPDFSQTARPLLEAIGTTLNSLDGIIKLTPDYGRFAGVADLLYEYTPHVLGIRRAAGGCGGKSSYSATGIVTALSHISSLASGACTLIGSEGAMGRDVATSRSIMWPRDVAVCDLQYGDVREALAVHRYPVLPAEYGRFTDSCLSRGGTIIATTFGNELQNSNIGTLPAGTTLLLAHNLSMPRGEDGVALAQALHAQSVLSIPGQLLTLGGALTSRLEWFSRQEGRTTFDKSRAHEVVKAVVDYLMGIALDHPKTPYEAAIELAQCAA